MAASARVAVLGAFATVGLSGIGCRNRATPKGTVEMDSYWIKVSAKDVQALAVAIDSLDAIVEQPFHGTKVESTLPPDVVRNLAFYAMDVKQTARDVAHLVGRFTGQEPASWLDRVGGAPALLFSALLALVAFVGGYLGGALTVLLLAIGA